MNSLENVLNLYNSLLIEYKFPTAAGTIEKDQKLANILEVLFYELNDLRNTVSDLSNRMLK